MSPGRRRKMVDREHPSLPIVRQCALLGVGRFSLYHRAKESSEADLCLMGGDGSAGPGDPILRVQADEGLAGEAWDTGKPEAGAAVDESHEAPGHLPESPHQPTGASGEHQCSPCLASTRSSTSCASLGLLSHWSESWTTAPPDT